MNSIEVCLSPVLYQFRTTFTGHVVVIIDVLRATTAICAAFDSGIKSVIPVSGLDELRVYKNKGYLTAAERDGNKIDFADFGNSPTVFLQSDLKGREMVYSTTNGTKAIEVAKDCKNIGIAAFTNLGAISKWLAGQKKNIVILCSGWKNTLSLEDMLCAGALIESLELSGEYAWAGDASWASVSLWTGAKNNLQQVIHHASHYKRLSAMRLNEDLEYCFKLNVSAAVPVWNGKEFRNLSAE